MEGSQRQCFAQGPLSQFQTLRLIVILGEDSASRLPPPLPARWLLAVLLLPQLQALLSIVLTVPGLSLLWSQCWNDCLFLKKQKGFLLFSNLVILLLK